MGKRGTYNLPASEKRKIPAFKMIYIGKIRRAPYKNFKCLCFFSSAFCNISYDYCCKYEQAANPEQP